MTLIANICFYLLAKVKTLTNVKAALPTLILSAFIIGQVTSTAHTHDHEIHDPHDFEHIHDLEHAHNAWNDHQHIDDRKQEEEPPHSACSVCILAVSQDEITVENSDLPELPAGPDFLKTPNIFEIYQAKELQVVLSYALEGQLKPALYSLYLDAARAPPLT